MTQTAEQLHFGFLPQLDVVVQRQVAQISSDAGLLPIAQFDRQWNYTARMAQCLSDTRQDPDHSVQEMLAQRLYGTPADQIKAKLTALREAREKAKTDLAAAQKELKEVLTARQEAVLVQMGTLE